MQSALEQFQISIKRIRDLIALHDSIYNQVTSVLDTSDILRDALVLTISSLDYYIHEVVTLVMLEIHRNERSEPSPSRNSNQSAFARFQVSLGVARQDRMIALDISNWLEEEIVQNYGYQSQQQSYTLSELLPMLSDIIKNKLNQSSWLRK